MYNQNKFYKIRQSKNIFEAFVCVMCFYLIYFTDQYLYEMTYIKVKS